MKARLELFTSDDHEVERLTLNGVPLIHGPSPYCHARTRLGAIQDALRVLGVPFEVTRHDEWDGETIPVPRMPLCVGLTGSIGAGKSTVLSWFEGPDFARIDADQVARQALEECGDEVAAVFPLAVAGGRVDRAWLGRMVLPHDRMRAKLEAILHPRVAARLREFAESVSPDKIAVIEIPLLFESTSDYSWLDATLAVVAPDDVRRRRVLARPGYLPVDFETRDAAQMPQAEKAARATWTLENGDSVSATHDAFVSIVDEMRGRRDLKEAD